MRVVIRGRSNVPIFDSKTDSLCKLFFGRAAAKRAEIVAPVDYDFRPVSQSARITVSTDGFVAAKTRLFIEDYAYQFQVQHSWDRMYLHGVDLFVPVGIMAKELLEPGETITEISKFSVTEPIFNNLDLVMITSKFKRRSDGRQASVKLTMKTSSGRSINVRGYQDGRPIDKIIRADDVLPKVFFKEDDMRVVPDARAGVITWFPMDSHIARSLARCARAQPGVYLKTLLDSVIIAGHEALVHQEVGSGVIYVSKFNEVVVPCITDLQKAQDLRLLILLRRDLSVYSRSSGHHLVPAIFEIREGEQNLLGRGEIQLAFSSDASGLNYLSEMRKKSCSE